MQDVEVSIWMTAEKRQLEWRPYRPPVRFEVSTDGYAMVLYRCGDVQTEGQLARPEEGVVVIDEPDTVAEFRANLAAFPAFVRDSLSGRITMMDLASAKGIPYCEFMTGIGFRSAAEAVLVRMTTPHV